jgi:hypothetical protein
MNGRFHRAFFSFGGPLPATHPGADWKRFYAALAASCLLHAAFVLMPYYGASTPVFPLAARGPQKPGPARAFDVRLRQGNAPATVPAPARPPAEPAAANSRGRPMANEEARPAPDRSRGSDFLPIPAPTYYTTDQLTKPPHPSAAPELDVPKRIARSVTGKVVLKLWIDELGDVNPVEVESSNLPAAVSEMAAAAFAKLRFIPGEIDGRRVRTLMRIEVVYVNGKRPPP